MFSIISNDNPSMKAIFHGYYFVDVAIQPFTIHNLPLQECANFD